MGGSTAHACTTRTTGCGIDLADSLPVATSGNRWQIGREWVARVENFGWSFVEPSGCWTSRSGLRRRRPARMGELAAESRTTAAARAFAGWPFNDDEIAMPDDAGYFEAAGRNVANLLDLLQQCGGIRRPRKAVSSERDLSQARRPKSVGIAPDSSKRAFARARNLWPRRVTRRIIKG